MPLAGVAWFAVFALTGCAGMRSTPGRVDVRRNNTQGVSWVRLGHMTVLGEGPFGLGVELDLGAAGVAAVHDAARAGKRGVDPRYVAFVVVRARRSTRDKDIYEDCHDLSIVVGGRALSVGDTEYSSGLFSGPERIMAVIPTEDMRSLAHTASIEIIVCDDALQLLPEHILALRRFARRLGDFPLTLTPEAALAASGLKATP